MVYWNGIYSKKSADYEELFAPLEAIIDCNVLLLGILLVKGKVMLEMNKQCYFLFPEKGNN